MKLVVLSFSHHGRSLGRTAQGLGHEIVGAMDGEEGSRGEMENEFDCPGFDSAGMCLDTVKPEGALVSGKHIEIPLHIQACVEPKHPQDKPGGLDSLVPITVAWKPKTTPRQAWGIALWPVSNSIDPAILRRGGRRFARGQHVRSPGAHTGIFLKMGPVRTKFGG